MQILTTGKGETTVVLSDEEVEILASALHDYALRPTLGEVPYVAAVGALHGEFGMLEQMLSLAEEHTQPDEPEPAAAG